MSCVAGVVSCVTVNVPDTPWWLEMLQIFVPVASALGLALLGYRFTLRSDLRSKSLEARLDIQRQAIDDVQQALKTFWITAAKLLRKPLEERLEKTDLLSAIENSGAILTVGHSRLQDRALADDVADWQHAVSLKLASPYVLSPAEVSDEHKNFVELSDRLGSRLRELTTVE